jgi:hypothetical protein
MMRLLDIDTDEDECSAIVKMNSQKAAMDVRVAFSRALWKGDLSEYRGITLGHWCVGRAFTFAFDNNLEALDKSLDWIRTFVYKNRDLQESEKILNSVGMKLIKE